MRQRRGADIEAQLHRVRNLVDVLPACALRADGGELDLVLGDEEAHCAEFGVRYVIVGIA
jgi:hypothetical protein